MAEKIITANWGNPDVVGIDGYMAGGGTGPCARRSG